MAGRTKDFDSENKTIGCAEGVADGQSIKNKMEEDVEINVADIDHGGSSEDEVSDTESQVHDKIKNNVFPQHTSDDFRYVLLLLYPIICVYILYTYIFLNTHKFL